MPFIIKIYRNKTELDYKTYNFVLHQGGLGDTIASLPAIKFILDFHPYIIINLFVHDYAVSLCQKVFDQYKAITVVGMSQYHEKANEALPVRSPYVHKLSNLSVNMVDHAFQTIVGTIPEAKYKNYLQLDPVDVSNFNLPEKYSVITTGFTSDSREWKAQSVNEVSDYLVSKGITPVYLGKSYTQSFKNVGITGTFKADYTKGISLIDKTNLFEAATIMGDAQVVLGLDNGLMHLAQMRNAKAIWGFTTVRPEHRLPPNTNHLVVCPTKQELACTFCQSDMTFASTDHTFTKCFYDDYKCLDLLGSEKWIEKLKEMGI
jgi:ADP-heptose:LPS heptosyltransferase